MIKSRFGLAQIPQVVMNIAYKLEPINDKNDAACFHDLEFNSYAKLLYHFKNINFTPDLYFFKLE